MSTSKCARCGKNVNVTVMISEGKLEVTSKLYDEKISASKEYCVECGKRPSLATLKNWLKEVLFGFNFQKLRIQMQ